MKDGGRSGRQVFICHLTLETGGERDDVRYVFRRKSVFILPESGPEEW